MKQLVIKDLKEIVELSTDDATSVIGGRDNKPSAPKPMGYELLDVLESNIGIPEEGEWIPTGGLQADNVTPLT